MTYPLTTRLTQLEALVELRKAEEARGEAVRGELEFFKKDFPELKD